MDSSIFLGGSVIAAFVAGMIVLFAPCCISVMLPAYFASLFQKRSVLVAMTFVFAGGIGTIILPLVMGISVLRHLLLSQHTLIYVVGGLFMLSLGIFTLVGRQSHLPMPGRRTDSKAGASFWLGRTARFYGEPIMVAHPTTPCLYPLLI